MNLEIGFELFLEKYLDNPWIPWINIALGVIFLIIAVVLFVNTRKKTGIVFLILGLIGVVGGIIRFFI